VQLPGISFPGIGFGKSLTVSANNHGRVPGSRGNMPAQVHKRWRKKEKTSRERCPARGSSVWSTTCNADPLSSPNSPQGQCRSPPTSLALLNSIVSLRPAALHPHRTALRGLAVAVAEDAKAVGVSLASSPNRTKLGSVFPRGRGQARSAPCQHRARVSVSRSRSSLDGPLPWVRHGGENGGGIVVVRSGLVRRIHEVHA